MNLKEFIQMLYSEDYFPKSQTSIGDIQKLFPTYLNKLEQNIDDNAVYFALGLLSVNFLNGKESHFIKALHNDKNFSASVFNLCLLVYEKNEKAKDINLTNEVVEQALQIYKVYLHNEKLETFEFLYEAAKEIIQCENLLHSSMPMAFIERGLLRANIPESSHPTPPFKI